MSPRGIYFLIAGTVSILKMFNKNSQSLLYKSSSTLIRKSQCWGEDVSTRIDSDDISGGESVVLKMAAVLSGFSVLLGRSAGSWRTHALLGTSVLGFILSNFVLIADSVSTLPRTQGIPEGARAGSAVSRNRLIPSCQERWYV